MRMKMLLSYVAIVSASMGAGAQTQLKSGLDMSYFDKSVSPSKSFYEYANGGWMKSHPLPAAYSRFGSFDQLQEDNNKRVNGIIEELNKNTYAKGTIEQKLSDLYKLAMDSVRRNREGAQPIMPLMNEIKKAKTVDGVFAVQCKLAKYGFQEFFFMGFGADEKNAGRNSLSMFQGGLTLGQKEYYLDNDAATKKIREAYKKHIVRMFKLYGFSSGEANNAMKNIMKVETSLAKVSKSQTELRNVEANYNKMTLDEIKAKYPHIQWLNLFDGFGIDTKYAQEAVVGQPSFMKGVDALVSGISADEYKSVLEWDVINSSATLLSDKIEAANFDFFGKTLHGRQSDFPRWKKAVNMVQNTMGEALGKMYVERYFPASSKERMVKLITRLQQSLAERIVAQNWMSDATKVNALNKLVNFYVKVGYPNKWRDYSKLDIDAKDSYFSNFLKCQAFSQKDEIERKAGKPVDRDEWQMTPQTVNAYYNPTTNEICFPAGILQKPFFDPEADDAFNLGAIGVVIGHEMTHGFDDQGRHYDFKGNMKDWWTDGDKKQFDERTKMFGDFFSSISVLPDLKANGSLTMGENLADHGGLQVAFNALKNSLRDNPLKTIDGLTPEQRFFVAYANVWAANITEAEIRSRTKSDPHSLGLWRVDGSLPHIDAWYEAFNVQPSDKMYIAKDKRLDLW